MCRIYVYYCQDGFDSLNNSLKCHKCHFRAHIETLFLVIYVLNMKPPNAVPKFEILQPPNPTLTSSTPYFIR